MERLRGEGVTGEKSGHINLHTLRVRLLEKKQFTRLGTSVRNSETMGLNCNFWERGSIFKRAFFGRDVVEWVETVLNQCKFGKNSCQSDIDNMTEMVESGNGVSRKEMAFRGKSFRGKGF